MKEFRKIPSLKFLYEVNSSGTIRNIKSKHILKPIPDKDGYLKISASIQGKTIKRFVHRLVAECWCDIPTGYDISKLEVNHKDYDITNNNASNLEWVSSKYNLDYSKERRLKALKESEKNIKAYTKTFNDWNKTQSKKLYVKELDMYFDNSFDCAKYLVENYFNDSNIKSLARYIRRQVKSSHYVKGFHIKQID